MTSTNGTLGGELVLVFPRIVPTDAAKALQRLQHFDNLGGAQRIGPEQQPAPERRKPIIYRKWQYSQVVKREIKKED